MTKKRKGLVIVNTGKGKGKTTAALGLLMRARGQGLQTCVIQFIKSDTGRWGEVKTAQELGIEWHKMGDGFTWLSKDVDESAAKARHGWKLAQEKIISGEYDLIVLDEFTYTMHFKWLDTQEVIDWLKANKPPEMHLVITGRYAPEALTEYADLVTEMTKIKHPFDQGRKAQRGIEF
ncbi:MAG: cob(I)yrinic acid a,c-diamide adenosyltransferase [Anaerolineales bacterium]|nr:cob(I)yrinic acid a,c-diamide adenosyltransferase [Chloroflexota bacterium]MBL7161621.1 cob(I)yrinic acid a,c-diamide adenosyltransferase [Anaerolineales bacterium]